MIKVIGKIVLPLLGVGLSMLSSAALKPVTLQQIVPTPIATNLTDAAMGTYKVTVKVSSGRHIERYPYVRVVGTDLITQCKGRYKTPTQQAIVQLNGNDISCRYI